MIPPQILAIGGGIVLLFGIVTGWTVRDWKAASAQLASVKAEDEIRDRMQATIDGNATKYEQWRAGAEPGRVETRSMIKEIYRDAPPVPALCAAPDAFVGLLDRQTAAANAATLGQSGATLPDPPAGAAPADRP